MDKLVIYKYILETFSPKWSMWQKMVCEENITSHRGQVIAWTMQRIVIHGNHFIYWQSDLDCCWQMSTTATRRKPCWKASPRWYWRSIPGFIFKNTSRSQGVTHVLTAMYRKPEHWMGRLWIT